MGGFARTSPSYETSYTADDVAGKNGWGEGYTFPCLFRNGDNGWTLVSETGVNGGYCASRLLGHKEELLRECPIYQKMWQDYAGTIEEADLKGGVENHA